MGLPINLKKETQIQTFDENANLRVVFGEDSNTEYQTLIEVIDDNNTIIGESIVGSLKSEGKWKIKKIITTGIITEIIYGDNNQLFELVWNDRNTYTYNII